MEQKDIEKFRVVGACVKMQTISWEEEMKLMDGTLFEIDFYQDFAEIYGDKPPCPIAYGRVVKEPIQKPEMKTVGSYEHYQALQRTHELFDYVDKMDRRERKAEEKWKKKRKKEGYSKKERMRNAERYFKYLDKELRG